MADPLLTMLAQAQSHLQAGRPEAALSLLQRAASAAPGSFQAHYLLAATLGRLRRAEEALETLNRALRLQPEHVGALFARATLLYELGRPADSLACLEHLLTIEPGHAAARAALSRLRESTPVEPPAAEPAREAPHPGIAEVEAAGDPAEAPRQESPAGDNYWPLTEAEATEVLASAGIHDHASVLRALADEDRLACAAAVLLGMSRDRSAVDALLGVLWRAKVRRQGSAGSVAACLALGNIGGLRAGRTLIETTQLRWLGHAAASGLVRLLLCAPETLESPDISRIVGLPRILQDVEVDGIVQAVEVDRAPLKELARAELQRRAAAARGGLGATGTGDSL